MKMQGNWVVLLLIGSKKIGDLAMKIRINDFNELYHLKVLSDFQMHLNSCGYNITEQIKYVTIDPKWISSMLELVHLRDVKDQNVIVNEHLKVLLPIGKANIKIYYNEGDFKEVEIGLPTKKGYKSKEIELEEFSIDRHLRFVTDSIVKLKIFVHDFKIWIK